MSDIVIVTIGTLLLTLCFVLAIVRWVFWVTQSFTAERKAWQIERRFLIDRTIAKHSGEILALDKMDERRTNGPEEPRPRIPTLPEGL
jgi:hypothetical protein